MASKSPMLKMLNDYGRDGLNPKIRGTDIAPLLTYKTILDFVPDTATSAILEPLEGGKAPLTHYRLRDFLLHEFDLKQFGIADGDRVSVLLPNGPELAVAMVAVLTKWCAAPINPTNTWQEIKSELISTQARAILILAGASANEAALQAADSLGVGVLVATPLESAAGLFRMTVLRPVPVSNVAIKIVADTVKGFKSYGHPETALLLHTSGTSGNKKLVPYSLDMIVIGVGCIISSWNLTGNDVCLNMMPLFHIGGIMRNILSPILSGGCVIACRGFDPLLFWDVLYSGQRVTWYYAAPTMHHALLQEAQRRSKPWPVEHMRFIANAAGGLLPVLAQGLKETFQATILTSYGMTECMPISSPPQNYNLDPTGTSGIPVGPEVIIVDDSMVTQNPPGVKGNIMVRGVPCFGGYENNGSANDESFFTVDGQDGWFSTGDMGHLDESGYLFISGRSKEIINRGGETISPFEIEEAVIQHACVKETLAFSAPHQEYQESVGAVIVTSAGSPRVDLPSLHKYLEDKLHRSKWPQIIVYMNSLPKNAAGKVLRIKLAERFKLKDVDEDSSPCTRLYEAECPPVGAPLTQPIAIRAVTIDTALTEAFLINTDKVRDAAVVVVDLPFRPSSLVAFASLPPDPADSPDTPSPPDERTLLQCSEALMKLCSEKLDMYLQPTFIHVVPGSLFVSDKDALRALALQLFAEKDIVLPRNTIEKQIEAIWREQLGAKSTVSVVVSFFALGGDSLKAGKMVAAMRKRLEVQLSVADLFTAPTIEAMAHKVLLLKTMGSPGMTRSGRPAKKTTSARMSKALGKPVPYKGPKSDLQHSVSQGFDAEEPDDEKYATLDFMSPFSNTSFPCLFVQGLPLLIIYPIRRIIIWFMIAGPWVQLMKLGVGRFAALIAAMLIMRITLAILAPIVGIALKWILIGRYQPGRYPLWGSMYLRWWFVEQVINVFGKGVFRDDLPIIGPQLVRLYYVMMGATIGRNVKIHRDAKLGQADLLTIGDDVCIDNAVVRPFTLEEGYFVLLPITIGSRCSVGVKSAVAAGAYLPPGTCLGPLSSSYESSEAEPHYRDYCRPDFPAPPAWLIIFLGLPILIAVAAISRLPWFFALHLMVYQAKTKGWYHHDLYNIRRAFLWWITPERIYYYFLFRAIRRCVVPYVRLTLAILLKRYLIGKFVPLSAEEKKRPWNAFRYWLMARLLPGGGLGGVGKLVGTHYAIISSIFRLLGAKVGNRVYWPGSGLEIVEYDLLEVGDDVVFGSRSVVLTASSKRSAKVTFEAGSMIADRCVVLPGVTVRRGAVLGSGSLAAEGLEVPTGSVWVGSRDGCAVNVAPSDPSYATNDTITPFGRAFYEHKASYFVLPLWFIVLYNNAWQIFCTCYRNSTTGISLYICNQLMMLDRVAYTPFEIFKFTFVVFVPLNLLLTVVALGIDIGSKFALLGTRKQGSYAWDESSYCQNWQVYLTLQEIRRAERRKAGILDMLSGTQYLVWYFRALGSQIGQNVCLYPNGGDPMMTEPDLVTVGNGVSIDDASLIAHINTRGVFRLNPLVVGDGCVCKSNTRLLSGATMEKHSIMLEHTLVLAGETVDCGKVWQGWPSTTQISLEAHRENVRRAVRDAARQSGALSYWYGPIKIATKRDSITTNVELESGNDLSTQATSSDEWFHDANERQPLLAVSSTTGVRSYSSAKV